MPVEFALWKLGPTPQRLSAAYLDQEKRLEDVVSGDLSLVESNLMLVGRQVVTAYQKFIDLLAMDSDGNLVVIELKRDKTPRDVIAQGLDYASWAATLGNAQISDIYREHHGREIEVGFEDSFGATLPETLNQRVEIVIVCSHLDPATERIVNYLNSAYGVHINAVFFKYFRDGENEYLARSWLIDPVQAEVHASSAPRGKKSSEAWNQRDFYISLGVGPERNWDDCRQYGFVSGGGGAWYSSTLRALFVDARVFVYVPKEGYVGVGVVTAEAMPIRDFAVSLSDREVRLIDAPVQATNLAHDLTDDEMCEWVVPVKWLATRPRPKAYREKGLFASQHTACKLRNAFTIQKLTEHFKLSE